MVTTTFVAGVAAHPIPLVAPLTSEPYTFPASAMLVLFAVPPLTFTLSVKDRVPGSPFAVSPILHTRVFPPFVIADTGVTHEVKHPGLRGLSNQVNPSGKVDSKYIFVPHSSFTVTSTV